MPVLSLHNTYSLPSGSASYTLGLSGAPNVSSYSYPSSAGASVLDRQLLASGIGGPSSGVSNLIGGITSSGVNSLGQPIGFNTNSAYSNYTNPLLTSGAIKLKPYDDLDLIGGGRYGPRAVTPSSPIPSAAWGIDSYTGLDGVNPAFIHTQRPLSRLGGLDLECKFWLKIIDLFLLVFSGLIFRYFFLCWFKLNDQKKNCFVRRDLLEN